MLIRHAHEVEVDEFGGYLIIDLEDVGVAPLEVDLLDVLEDDEWVDFESLMLIYETIYFSLKYRFMFCLDLAVSRLGSQFKMINSL